MGVIATFNYSTWVQLFPNFAYLSEQQALGLWNLATQFHRNDGGGPIGTTCLVPGVTPEAQSATDIVTQTNLLNLVTAHLAQLFAPKPDATGQLNRDPNAVGRITNASEGSVSVATELPITNPNAAWWCQTQYGLAYWQASAPYRTMRYMRGHPRLTNPFPIFGWPNLGQ